MRRLRYFLGGRLFLFTLIFIPTVLAACALAVWLPRALAPIALLERSFSLVVALITVNGSSVAESKLPKLLLIGFLPWTGAILCLLLYRRKTDRRPHLANAAPLYAESVEYFPVGREMYERLLADVESARSFIWLEYYIVAQGAFFHALCERLEAKANEGLDVRLYYDDFGCSLTLPSRFEAELQKRGIHARALRPIRFPFGNLNRRNHRKIAIIDGEIAYTGGINLADEYIGEKIRFGHWKDTAVRVTGEPAAFFTKLISEDAKIALPELSPAKGEIPCAVVADGTGGERAGVYAIVSMIGSATERLFLNTPYLAPDAATASALKAAALRGVDVRLMIPHIPDKRAPFLISKSYARELERAGVQIREYTAGFLHAKSLVADGRLCFVSSYNLDFRSLYLQAECGLRAEDELLAKVLEQDFLSAWEAGTPVRKSGRLERGIAAVLRLFAPLV